MFDNKKILITGGTGSFGNAVVRKIMKENVEEIRIFSRDELKQDVMRHELADSRLRFHIGDVRDRSSVDRAMKGVDMAFHAAALKQVPSCEFFPDQAIRTNVIGSENVIDSAIEHGVGHVVCLSTDKAVQPVNVMGMSKALMEKTVQAKARSLGAKADTILSCVRYGNVLYTRGSVVPLFIDQILNRRPISITSPAMTRFLLRLSEAIDLVEFALLNSRQGDLFIRRSPACTVATLADALKRMFHSDVPINIIGVRHGEKIHETLASFEEVCRGEDIGKFIRVPMDGRDLNYSGFLEEGNTKLNEAEAYTSENAERLDIAGTVEILRGVPQIEALMAGKGSSGRAVLDRT